MCVHIVQLLSTQDSHTRTCSGDLSTRLQCLKNIPNNSHFYVLSISDAFITKKLKKNKFTIPQNLDFCILQQSFFMVPNHIFPKFVSIDRKEWNSNETIFLFFKHCYEKAQDFFCKFGIRRQRDKSAFPTF